MNHVAIGPAADAIRAIGALPVMASDPLEAGDMAAQASAVVLNTGTPDPRRFDACLAAGRRANAAGVPVVLDPVGMGATPWRTSEIERLLAEVRFAAIRGNASEIHAITTSPAAAGEGPRGVEAAGTYTQQELQEIATAVRWRTGAVICISGAADVVAGQRVAIARNGHPLMGEVVGTGCMLSGVIAAFLAVERDAEQAVLQAVVAYGLAGESAARQAQGPGAFRVALIDCLAEIQRERTARGVRVEVLP